MSLFSIRALFKKAPCGQSMLLGGMLSSILLPVHAADNVIISFTGNIQQASCTVDGPTNIPVDLGTLQATSLAAAGSSSTWIPFSLKLNNCPNGLLTATATFTGTPDSQDINSMYKNTGTSNPLAVQLQSGDGTLALGNNKTWQRQVTGNTVTYDLRTRAYSGAGAVNPGTIGAVVVATFTYQ